MGIEAHERKGSTMEAQHAGTITEDEDMEGIELGRLLNKHWRCGAGSMLYFDELISACRATETSADDVMEFIDAVNSYRHHKYEDDVMDTSFVPQENIEAVTALLDQVAALCVSDVAPRDRR